MAFSGPDTVGSSSSMIDTSRVNAEGRGTMRSSINYFSAVNKEHVQNEAALKGVEGHRCGNSDGVRAPLPDRAQSSGDMMRGMVVPPISQAAAAVTGATTEVCLICHRSELPHHFPAPMTEPESWIRWLLFPPYVGKLPSPLDVFARLGPVSIHFRCGFHNATRCNGTDVIQSTMMCYKPNKSYFDQAMQLCRKGIPSNSLAYTSPRYVLRAELDWYYDLIEKNNLQRQQKKLQGAGSRKRERCVMDGTKKLVESTSVTASTAASFTSEVAPDTARSSSSTFVQEPQRQKAGGINKEGEMYTTTGSEPFSAISSAPDASRVESVPNGGGSSPSSSGAGIQPSSPKRQRHAYATSAPRCHSATSPQPKQRRRCSCTWPNNWCEYVQIVAAQRQDMQLVGHCSVSSGSVNSGLDKKRESCARSIERHLKPMDKAQNGSTKRYYVAKHHWNRKLLLLNQIKHRIVSTMISTEEAKKCGITDPMDCFDPAKGLWVQAPNVPIEEMIDYVRQGKGCAHAGSKKGDHKKQDRKENAAVNDTPEPPLCAGGKVVYAPVLRGTSEEASNIATAKSNVRALPLDKPPPLPFAKPLDHAKKESSKVAKLRADNFELKQQLKALHAQLSKYETPGERQQSQTQDAVFPFTWTVHGTSKSKNGAAAENPPKDEDRSKVVLPMHLHQIEKLLLSRGAGLNRFNIFRDEWHGNNPTASHILFGYATWEITKAALQRHFPTYFAPRSCVTKQVAVEELLPAAIGTSICKLLEDGSFSMSSQYGTQYSEFEKCLMARMVLRGSSTSKTPVNRANGVTSGPADKAKAASLDYKRMTLVMGGSPGPKTMEFLLRPWIERWENVSSPKDAR